MHGGGPKECVQFGAGGGRNFTGAPEFYDTALPGTGGLLLSALPVSEATPPRCPLPPALLGLHPYD